MESLLTTTLPDASVKLAEVARENINSYVGGMQEKSRIKMASNLWEIIDRAKKNGISKGQIVLHSELRYKIDPAKAANELGFYCLTPGRDDYGAAINRLKAKPGNYLKLAIAAAELSGVPLHDSVLHLIDGVDEFEGTSTWNMPPSTEAGVVYTTFLAVLNSIERKYSLLERFKGIVGDQAAGVSNTLPVEKLPAEHLVLAFLPGKERSSSSIDLIVGCDGWGKIVHYLRFYEFGGEEGATKYARLTLSMFDWAFNNSNVRLTPIEIDYLDGRKYMSKLNSAMGYIEAKLLDDDGGLFCTIGEDIEKMVEKLKKHGQDHITEVMARHQAVRNTANQE